MGEEASISGFLCVFTVHDCLWCGQVQNSYVRPNESQKLSSLLLLNDSIFFVILSLWTVSTVFELSNWKEAYFQLWSKLRIGPE